MSRRTSVGGATDPNSGLRPRPSSVGEQEIAAARPGSRPHALIGDAVLLRGEAAARARKIDLVSGVHAVPLGAPHHPSAPVGDSRFEFEDLGAKELADARREGRVEGFEQGLKTGFEQGKAEGEAEALAAHTQHQHDVDSRLSGVLASLEGRLSELADYVAGSTVDLALEIAEAVLARELAAVEDPGADALARCLDLVPPLGKMVIRLHPDDAEVFAGLPGMADREMTVVPDEQLSSGDAVISVEQTTIDGRISESLRRVAEALR